MFLEKSTTPLFVCYGGSGSTFLLKRMRRRHFCPARPETYWLPHYFPQQTKSATKFDQQLDEKGYENKPSSASIAGFQRRTKFSLIPRWTIDKNLATYVDFVLGQHKHWPMFSRSPMFGFFSRNKIPNATFVVRHPMHQYISLTKPHRHFEFVEETGGVNTEASVSFWIREWTAYVRDALESQSDVVRYEYVGEDRSKLRLEAARVVFAKWDASRRNPGKLLPEREEQLREGTKELYDQLYDAWEV